MGVFHKKKKEYIVIVGCGRLGASLATVLSDQNKSVTVIDISEEAFRKLPLSYGGFTIVGDGTDMDILNDINIREADVLIASTDNDDTNIMAAQIAKQICKVKKVVVRIRDDSKQAAYNDADIESICPAVLSVREFERIVAQETAS